MTGTRHSFAWGFRPRLPPASDTRARRGRCTARARGTDRTHATHHPSQLVLLPRTACVQGVDGAQNASSPRRDWYGLCHPQRRGEFYVAGRLPHPTRGAPAIRSPRVARDVWRRRRTALTRPRRSCTRTSCRPSVGTAHRSPASAAVVPQHGSAAGRGQRHTHPRGPRFDDPAECGRAPKSGAVPCTRGLPSVSRGTARLRHRRTEMSTPTLGEALSRRRADSHVRHHLRADDRRTCSVCARESQCP